MVLTASLLVDLEISFASFEGTLEEVVRRVSRVSSEYTSRKIEKSVIVVGTSPVLAMTSLGLC